MLGDPTGGVFLAEWPPVRGNVAVFTT
jgi:hypothetical protein